MTQGEIAARLGISRDSVSLHLAALGINARPGLRCHPAAYTAEEITLLQELTAAGCGAAEIGARLMRSPASIRVRRCKLKRAGA
jgi:DNA-binding CsgD family transcriptional regulator